MTDWFKTSLGQWLVQQEKQHCQRLIPDGYYPTALQLGMGSEDYLAEVEIGCRFVAESPIEVTETSGDVSEPAVHRVQALPTALPFSDKTHSLIVMPHIMDFCEDPHAVLREVNQILIPEGCVVITGFNQVSLWSAGRLGWKKYANAPWNGHYYRVKRVQDWLALLGIDIVGAKMFGYRPPLQSEKWRNKLNIVESIGDRWWPGLGAAYMIVGKKREIASSTSGMRLAWQRFIPAIARPAIPATGSLSATRAEVGKTRLRLVVKNQF
ncbi:MAG: class I SAM-dependent methyltransferase [bacterium]